VTRAFGATKPPEPPPIIVNHNHKKSLTFSCLRDLVRCV
jgi:hypothetical protein